MMMNDSGCSEEGECEGKWDVTLNYNPKPKLAFDSEYITGEYKITDAREILFSGSIYKVHHCTGKQGEIFEYYDVIDPKIYSLEALKQGIWLGRAYGFKFEHEKDYLYLNYTVTVTFEDNETAYVSLNKQIFYLDIREDIDNYKDYFLLEVSYYHNWQFQ